MDHQSKNLLDVIIKRFDAPDEIRELEKGKFEILFLPQMTLGRATYYPGWKWSNDVSPLSNTKFCEVEHLGMVIEGCATIAFDDHKIIILNPGDIFYVPPIPHDSYVVGQENYISIHFLGAEFYAK